MSKEILDEAEKHKGPRRCPSCGYQYPFARFVSHYVLSFGLSKWSCQSCKEVLKCDFMAIQTMWLVGLFVFGGLFGVLGSYFDWGVFNLIFITPYFAFIYLTLFYAKFERNKE